MLGEDTQHKAKRPGGGNWPILLLVVAKALRSSSLFSAFSLLYQLPLLLYVFLVISGSSIFFLAIQRPWNGTKQLKGNQWIRICIYALILVINTALWNYGLKYYGPIRTILSSDYAEFVILIVVTTISSAKSLQDIKVQGALAIVFGYTLLFWFGSTPQLPEPEFVNQYNSGFIDDGKVGGICLFMAVGLTAFRKSIARRVLGDIGTKRLFSLSSGVSACLLFPIAIYQFFTYPIDMGGSTMLSLIVVIIFTVVVDYYVDSISTMQLEPHTLAQTSIAVGFVVAWFIAWINGIGGGGFIEWLSFALIVGGIYPLFSKGIDSALPVFSATSSAVGGVLSPLTGPRHATQGFTVSALIHVIKAILEKSASRRIFGFLLVNLMFMFVELLYGVWTNSLGLITDACHMLFDCTALFIALYAEVISQWDANQVFSYGYGRVQVLSGFVNGIFLVFIAFFVMMESLERFVEPPEVKTDRLLLVSTLGFLVDIVGVVSFHDHGGHGHGGHDDADHGAEHTTDVKKKDKHKDHDHSHDHGHDDHGHHDHEHSHDKPKKEKKEKKKDHGHSHGHSHSHAHRSENLEGVFLHLLADTLGSVGVIISSFIIQMWGWTLADPICSLCIAVLIFLSTIPLIKQSSKTLLQCTPSYFEEPLGLVLQKVEKIEGVRGYRDPHFWNHANEILVGTIHIQIDEKANEQRILQLVSNLFKEEGVTHLTVEIEKPSSSTSLRANESNYQMAT